MIFHYRTIVLSDIHLGTSGSKAKEVAHFLKYNTCDTLILNGDIIDGWQLNKFGKWKKQHTRFFKRVLKMVEKYNTRVIYLRGNHDDFLDTVIPITIGNISIQKDLILESGTKRFYVIHGDIFDSVISNLKWIAKLGDIGYTFLLWFNQRYNNYRTKRGLPYYSLSQVIKSKVKKAVSYISEFENEIVFLARLKKCDGVICGHIHHAAIKNIEGLKYMNSGDWVESMTALVEDHQNEWRIFDFLSMKSLAEGMDEEEDLDFEEPLNLLLIKEEMDLRKKA